MPRIARTIPARKSTGLVASMTRTAPAGPIELAFNALVTAAIASASASRPIRTTAQLFSSAILAGPVSRRFPRAPCPNGQVLQPKFDKSADLYRLAWSLFRPRITIFPVTTSVGQKIDVKPVATATFWTPPAA